MWCFAVRGTHLFAGTDSGVVLSADIGVSWTAVNSGLTYTLIASLVLDENYLYPFNPSTTIRYALPSGSHIIPTIFSTLGQVVYELVNGEKEAGYHSVNFDASGLSSGVYLYRIQAGNSAEMKRLLLIR